MAASYPRGDAERLEWDQSPESGARPTRPEPEPPEPEGERFYSFRAQCIKCEKWSAMSVPAGDIEKAGNRRVEDLEAGYEDKRVWIEELEAIVQNGFKLRDTAKKRGRSALSHEERRLVIESLKYALNRGPIGNAAGGWTPIANALLARLEADEAKQA